MTEPLFQDGEVEQHCDLCNSTTGISWEWETPNKYDTPAEAQANDSYWFEDPVWYVCDTCQRMITDESWDQLLQRAYFMISKTGTFLAVSDPVTDELRLLDARHHVANTHRAFRENRTTHRKLTT